MALLQDFWITLFRDGTGCGAPACSQSMASYSDRLTSCFLELEKGNQDLENELRDDFLCILNGMGNISVSSAPQPLSPPPPSRSSSITHDISFVTEAYSWLLDNIANPYPSSTVKASFAQQYNYSISAVNSWFVNTRRRIGWTTLCRDYFNNCRADALDAARRALVKEDLNRPLPPGVIHSFVSVKVAAEEFYSSILTGSGFADDLGTVAKDMLEKENISMKKRKRRAPERTLLKPLDVTHNCSPSSSYTSSSLIPALDGSRTDESQGNEDTLLPTHGYHKRPLSSDAIRTPVSDLRPAKRLRPSPSPLPSPSASTGEFLENNQTSQPTLLPQNFTSTKIHKRWPSDADAAGLPKCSRDSAVGPPLYADSDSLPLSMPDSEASIDERFKTNFDALFSLPLPVDVAEPNLSTQWEVELFNEYFIPENVQKALSPSISTLSGPAAFGDFFQSFGDGGCIALPEITQPATIPVVADSQGLSILSDSPRSIDWTALLNENPSKPASDPIFSRSHTNSVLPVIDLSISQLPHLWTVVAS